MEKILKFLFVKNERRHSWHQTSIGVMLMLTVPFLVLFGILGVSLGILTRVFVAIFVFALIMGSICYSNEKKNLTPNAYQKLVYAIWDMAVEMKENPAQCIKGVWSNYKITKDDTKKEALRKLVICIGIIVYTVIGGAITFGCFIAAAGMIGGFMGGNGYRICPHCGANIVANSEYCPDCGGALF